MNKWRTFGLMVIFVHWAVAVWHLVLAARILQTPVAHVSWFAIGSLSMLHVVVSGLWWKLSDQLAGLVMVIFFAAALASGIYEHFVHPGANNVFSVAPGMWAASFQVSVMLLLVLQVFGCWVGVRSLRKIRSNRDGILSPPNM